MGERRDPARLERAAGVATAEADTMTERIEIPADQPDASYGQIGDMFYGIFRLPHGSWRDLVDRKGERIPFANAQEATRAAFARVNNLLFKQIKADADLGALPGASKLAAEAARFQASKRARVVRRGDGKRPFTVETKRGR